MKKYLLFAVCCLLFASTLHADDFDAVRAAKRSSANTIAATAVRTPESRGAGGGGGNGQRSTTNDARENAIGQSRSTTTQTVAPRTTGAVQPRLVSPAIPRTAARSATTTPGISARSAARTAATPPMRSTVTSARSATLVRAATTATAPATDYKKCREVYYSCMDEFCANKDTQLKRCACSSRVNEFDGVRAQLAKIEGQMLDFNERLLTVNMDKEDVAAISQATVGELAYQTEDKSDSKGMLDEISKKLQENTYDTDMSRNLSAINLSLDMDSAFDTIDSMMGASTTTKEGTALYGAALPVCREMAMEVCDEDALSIAENGYMMAIEQDCNTVAKTYETMQTQAMEKVREGSALLDMSRLDIYQKRNSDDILTCKKKMLDMLADSAVCGTDLGKCLDTTGKYIDPLTGEAFLTEHLVDLDTQITRPSGGQKWTTVPGNDKFVAFLNNKKKYLEPAMENCQIIADSVWNAFMEDALAQIKLAQSQKLEDMRQSCTSLTTQCLTDTAKSVSDFDARALSIFGVSADRTVNEMCASVKTACTALLETTNGDMDWVGGMTEIETDKTFETIIQTCREVGKACIIQTCKSVSGNFGLCESIDRSVNRKSIINRTACWNEVVQCVQSAGVQKVDSIVGKYATYEYNNNHSFYDTLYQADTSTVIKTDNTYITATSCPIPESERGNNYIFDICAAIGCGTGGQIDCNTCRLAERIWGNCEFSPSTTLSCENAFNRIKTPKTETGVNDTLLSWFNRNSGTSGPDVLDSCRDTTCPVGWSLEDGVCTNNANKSSDGVSCDAVFQVSSGWTNCGDGLQTDVYKNRCDKISDGNITDSNINGRICLPDNVNNDNQLQYIHTFNGGGGSYPAGSENVLFCVCDSSTSCLSGDDVDDDGYYPRGQTVKCNGDWVIVDKAHGTYRSPYFIVPPAPATNPNDEKSSWPKNYYKTVNSGKCILNHNGLGPEWTGVCGVITGYPTNDDNNPDNDNNLFIEY